MADNEVDLVVGAAIAEGTAIPRDLVRKIEVGMSTYFPQLKWALASDGYRAFLSTARRLKAQACLVIDPLQTGFNASWIESLLRPGIHSHCDLVTPLYAASGREHLLSSQLTSPLMLALFGSAPALPMPGEFLLSSRLIDRLLERQDWDSRAARYAPALWTSFIATAERYRIAESWVGPSARRAAPAKLARHTVIGRVVEGLLVLTDQYEKQWLSSTELLGPEQFGEANFTEEPLQVDDGLSYLVGFMDSIPAFESEWRSLFDRHTFQEIRAFHDGLRDGPMDQSLSDGTWARIVYEAAAAWKKRRLPRAQIVGLLIPLFLGRAGSYLMQTRTESQKEVQRRLMRLGGMFIALQPVLRRLWSDSAAPAGSQWEAA